MIEAVIITSAAPDRDTAERIATALVEDGLAACVHLRAIDSVYRWQGTIERAGEIAIDIHTSADRYDAVAARIAALHPYDLPAILMVAIAGGSPAYLDWIARAGG